jgi:hypothetical protein
VGQHGVEGTVESEASYEPQWLLIGFAVLVLEGGIEKLIERPLCSSLSMLRSGGGRFNVRFVLAWGWLSGICHGRLSYSTYVDACGTLDGKGRHVAQLRSIPPVCRSGECGGIASQTPVG